MRGAREGVRDVMRRFLRGRLSATENHRRRVYTDTESRISVDAGEKGLAIVEL